MLIKWLGRLFIAIALFFVVSLSGLHNLFIVLPDGISVESDWLPVTDVQLISDLTFEDKNGQRQIEHQIFDATLEMIQQANQTLLLDMFLFNDFAGETLPGGRTLADDLTNALLEKKQRHPEIKIHLITDPINTLYGGYRSPYLQRLMDADISVVITDLLVLKDSNPGYSLFWRLFVRPWGNEAGVSTIKNPLGSGEVSLRSVLSMLNFKANHRKLIVADVAEDYRALVSSANPHDGSSLHSNLGIQFSGPAARKLYEIEAKLITFSSGVVLPSLAEKEYAPTKGQIKVLTEGRIRAAVLRELAQAQDKDQIDISVFYLSERAVIRALKEARQRGARIRVLLDPNKDAFGRKKSGVPNRPVAKELKEAGIEVRWCATNGEQCHSKWLLSRPRAGESTLILGSANFTRRNLNDFNLETNVAYRAAADDKIIVEAGDLFARLWNNEGGEQHSYDYGVMPPLGPWHTLKYRIMEMTGMSTF